MHHFLQIATKHYFMFSSRILYKNLYLVAMPFFLIFMQMFLFCVCIFALFHLFLLLFLRVFNEEKYTHKICIAYNFIVFFSSSHPREHTSYEDKTTQYTCSFKLHVVCLYFYFHFLYYHFSNSTMIP